MSEHSEEAAEAAQQAAEQTQGAAKNAGKAAKESAEAVAEAVAEEAQEVAQDAAEAARRVDLTLIGAVISETGMGLLAAGGCIFLGGFAANRFQTAYRTARGRAV